MVVQTLKIEGTLRSNGTPVKNEHVGIYDLKSYEYLDNATTDIDGNFSLRTRRRNLKKARFEISIPRYSSARSAVGKDYNNYIRIPIREVLTNSTVFNVGIIELSELSTKIRTSRSRNLEK
ncbi:unnamed protein product [Bursaphelenchus xylophilus]|uniref:(pine wood nematode) hypothetical protein n=1 Tax=Bursaphelenchus xylophilus TaxID=6326 RepID=A0A7I8XKS7_BURXY|nr:unnamed protein product [Bursaphelenchus xylophilus]CAG9120829.1 unnamed protein product [Bursaphelenchus xylophilus]